MISTLNDNNKTTYNISAWWLSQMKWISITEPHAWYYSETNNYHSMSTSYILGHDTACVSHISACPGITGTDSLLFWLVFSSMMVQQIASEDKNGVSIWNIYIYSLFGIYTYSPFLAKFGQMGRFACSQL